MRENFSPKFALTHSTSLRFTPSEIGDYTIDVTYEDVVEETAGDKNANTASYLLHAVPKVGHTYKTHTVMLS